MSFEYNFEYKHRPKVCVQSGVEALMLKTTKLQVHILMLLDLVTVYECEQESMCVYRLLQCVVLSMRI